MNVAPEPAVVVVPLEAKSFSGIVFNELGAPLAGAVVSVVVGKNRFAIITTTNADGEYVLQTTDASPLLLVSYAGYADISKQATYARPISFQLEPVQNYEQQLSKKSKTADKAWHN